MKETINSEFKNKYRIASLRVDMAAEAVSDNELEYMKNLSNNLDVGLTVKIGGCDAVTDIYYAKKYGATAIISPMIESDYALKKFVDACIKVYSNELKNINLFINIETATAYNNLDLILKSAYIQYITGIVLGRDDMAISSNIELKNINSDKMLIITKNIAEKVFNNQKKFIVGGGIRPDSIFFLKQIPISQISFYETRRIVFEAGALQSKNARDGIKKALEFEIKCLNTISEFNNQDRIKDLKFYLK